VTFDLFHQTKYGGKIISDLVLAASELFEIIENWLRLMKLALGS
jgi:hypothetical protein